MEQRMEFSRKESFFSVFGFQNLKIFFEKLPFVVVVVDSEERVLYINAAGERLYECNFSNVEKMPLSKMMFLSNPRIITDAVARVFKGETIFRLEWEEEQYYEGRVFWRQGTLFPLTDQKGNVTYAAISIIDITEHMRLQKKLMRSQEQYRLLFESAPDAILILNGYQIIGANPASERIMGYKKEELVGKRMGEISPDFQTEGILAKDMIEDNIAKALNGEAQFFEWKCVCKNGEIMNTQVSLATMGTPDTPQPTSFLQAIVRKT